MKKTFALILIAYCIAAPAARAVTPEQADESALIPATVTSQAPVSSALDALHAVTLPAEFTAPNARTTSLAQVTKTDVTDLTIDVPGKGKVVFRESVDLSGIEAQTYLRELAAHLQIEPLRIGIDSGLLRVMDSPVEFTFYGSPFVWDPAVTIDGVVADQSAFQRFSRTTIDGIDVVSFITNAPGVYALVPKLDLQFDNEKTVKQASFPFTGRVSDPKAKVRITVNTTDIPASAVTVDPSTGEFSATALLANGSNIIIARADSQYGEAAPVNRLVIFEEKPVTVPAKRELSPIVFLAAALFVVMVGLVIAVRMARR